MQPVDKVFFSTTGLRSNLPGVQDVLFSQSFAWEDTYFVVSESKLLMLKPSPQVWGAMKQSYPVEAEIPLHSISSAFISRPGWETQIESVCDDHLYLLPKDVNEILVIIDTKMKTRILIGLHQKDVAQSFHRSIVAAKAVQNMFFREPGGILNMMKRNLEAMQVLKNQIYGWPLIKICIALSVRVHPNSS